MNHRSIALSVVAAALLGALPVGLVALPASAAPPSHTCSGGAVAPGTYYDLTATGECTIGAGKVTVQHILTVATAGSLTNTGGSTVVVGAGVSVQPQGSLTLTSAHIVGGVQADNPTFVFLTSSTVHNGVHVTGGVNLGVASSSITGGITQQNMSSPGNTDVDHSTVSGGIVIGTGAIRGGADVTDNSVTGDLRVSHLLSLPYLGSRISGNTVTGNLVCRADTPAPTNGGQANTVAGLELGQCAGL